MKKRFLIVMLLVVLALVSCNPGSETLAVMPVDLTDEVTISNGDFDLTVYEITEIESKTLGSQNISLKDDAKEEYGFYEIRMRYSNQTDEEDILSYRQLWFSLPEVEDPGKDLSVVGYCEPESDNPTGNPTWCAYLPPPPQPGRYGVVAVYHTPSPRIQPGEQARLNIFVILKRDQPELEISFVEPE